MAKIKEIKIQEDQLPVFPGRSGGLLRNPIEGHRIRIENEINSPYEEILNIRPPVIKKQPNVIERHPENFHCESWFYVPARKECLADCIKKVWEIDPYATILDIGCGPGRSTLALASKTFSKRVIGIDFDKDYIEQAKKEAERFGYKNIEFIHADAVNFDYSSLNLYGNVCIYMYQPFIGDLKEKFDENIQNFVNQQKVYLFPILSNICNTLRFVGDYKNSYIKPTQKEQINA